MATTVHNEKKLSLAQFIWMGFNYAVGIGFVGNLAVISNFYMYDKVANKWVYNTDSIGAHTIWLFLLLGLISSICALAFAKMAKIHKSDNNGGAYLYARTAFGKFTGFMVAFVQYIILPFLITVQIFNLMKAFFMGEFAGNTGMGLDTALSKVGAESWTSLILDLIGILVYFVFAFVIFGGMKFFKKMSSAAGYIKWITSGVLILAAIAMACMPSNHGNLGKWFDGPVNGQIMGDGQTANTEGHTLLTFDNFTKAFTSSFFFFAGFETFATAGKNIQNPDKNLGKGIMLIMLISTIFYIAMIFVFLGATNPYDKDGGLLQNTNMGLWTKDPIAGIKWLSMGGMIVMILSQFALKANVAMQNALYGGTMIQPMAVEGYLPEKYNELNKDDLPVKASGLNFIITGIILLLWLIVPDIYQGITGAPAIFNVAQLTEASSAITLFIYAVTILAVFKHAFKKEIKLRVIEWIAYVPVFIILVFMFSYHYVLLFENLQYFGSKKGDSAIGAVLELIFIIGSVSFGLIWYFTYYLSKLKKRLSTPEGVKLQEQLDAEFVLITDDIKIFSDPSILGRKSKEERDAIKAEKILNKSGNYLYDKEADRMKTVILDDKVDSNKDDNKNSEDK